MGGKETGQSGVQGLLSTGTRSVKSFHKSALPPGGHIRALAWGEEYLRCVCLSWNSLGTQWRGDKERTQDISHQIGHWNV